MKSSLWIYGRPVSSPFSLFSLALNWLIQFWRNVQRNIYTFFCRRPSTLFTFVVLSCILYIPLLSQNTVNSSVVENISLLPMYVTVTWSWQAESGAVTIIFLSKMIQPRFLHTLAKRRSSNPRSPEFIIFKVHVSFPSSSSCQASLPI